MKDTRLLVRLIGRAGKVFPLCEPCSEHLLTTLNVDLCKMFPFCKARQGKAQHKAKQSKAKQDRRSKKGKDRTGQDKKIKLSE